MRLHVRLGILFGSLLVLVFAALAAILYWQARSAFVRRSAEQADRVTETALKIGDRRARELNESVAQLAGDFQIGILMRDARSAGASQKRLIDLLSARVRDGGLHELTAVSPDGVVLGRGHQPADFGDAAESAPLSVPYFRPQSSMLRIRLPVRLHSRGAGHIEVGLDLADDLSEMGRLFGGQVSLSAAGAAGSAGAPATRHAPGQFRFASSAEWRLSDGTVLADLIFESTDEESRQMFRNLIARGAAVLLVALLAAGIGVAAVARSVSRPVRQLAQAAAEISRGRRQLELPPAGGSEVGELADAFARMASSLDESQKKLLAAERLAAWQDAARMLAHEIKNPLSPIKTTASTLARAAQDKDPGLGRLAERGSVTILSEIGHLEKLLSEFSAFARFPSPHPAPGDFNAAVRAAVEQFREKVRHIRWVERYGDGIPPALIDAGMFAEVVRNLILNAAEAGAQLIHLQTARDARHAVLTLCDSGPGIDAGRRGSLFTPYFTTKSGGAGLGLAVSRKIMIEHGGDLTLLDASPFDDARGAAFRATLPLAAGR